MLLLHHQLPPSTVFTVKVKGESEVEATQRQSLCDRLLVFASLSSVSVQIQEPRCLNQ